jgi:hypothetical protein
MRFEDDGFISDRRWLPYFLAQYRRRIGKPFSCYIRIDHLAEDLASELKDSGCHLLVFSVETGDERVRAELLKKPIKDDEIAKGAEICRRYGLRFAIGNMLGLPDETVEQAWATVHFNRRLRPAFSICSIYQPYPSTESPAKQLDAAPTVQPDLDAISMIYHHNSVIRQNDIDPIVNLHKFFDIAVKHQWLEGFIKALIRLPPNGVFVWLHNLSYFGWYRGHSGNRLSFTLKYFFTLRKALRESACND